MGRHGDRGFSERGRFGALGFVTGCGLGPGTRARRPVGAGLAHRDRRNAGREEHARAAVGSGAGRKPRGGASRKRRALARRRGRRCRTDETRIRGVRAALLKAALVPIPNTTGARLAPRTRCFPRGSGEGGQKPGGRDHSSSPATGSNWSSGDKLFRGGSAVPGTSRADLVLVFFFCFFFEAGRLSATRFEAARAAGRASSRCPAGAGCEKGALRGTGFLTDNRSIPLNFRSNRLGGRRPVPSGDLGSRTASFWPCDRDPRAGLVTRPAYDGYSGPAFRREAGAEGHRDTRGTLPRPPVSKQGRSCFSFVPVLRGKSEGRARSGPARRSRRGILPRARIQLTFLFSWSRIRP